MRRTARKIFELLGKHANSPEFDPRDRKTWLRYGDVHDRLGFEQFGSYGESLNKHGLEDVARYCQENGLPELTSIVVSKDTLFPGDGYYKFFNISDLTDIADRLERIALRASKINWREVWEGIALDQESPTRGSSGSSGSPTGAMQVSLLDSVEDYEREQSHFEGRVSPKEGLERARSAALVEKAREHWASVNNGILQCHGCDWVVPKAVREVCDYAIIEMHHTRPLSAYPDEGERLNEKDAIDRLRPLCPTCHRIAHGKEGRELFFIDELRVLNGKGSKK